MKAGLAVLPCLLALAGTFATAHQAGEHPLGPVAELSAVTDIAGRTARLADASDAAVLLFFHAGSSRYSFSGLDELVERLRVPGETRTRTRLYVLAATPEEAREVEPHLVALGDGARVLVDPSRGTFAAQGVIAAPTVLCVTPQRLAVARVQGYGALFAFRAELGARLAAGLIEREAYEAALNGAHADPAPDAAETRARILAGKLVAAGELAEAERQLTAARVNYPRAAWPLALEARCLVTRGKLPEARALAAELERAQAGTPEGRYVEALLLEAVGELEQARATYRAGLEGCLFE